MNTRAVCLSFFCWTGICFASDPSIDSLMNLEDQTKTGYNTLTADQKKALNVWVYTQFSLKTNLEDKSLSLSINVQNGKILILSDGSKWEVAPADQSISSLWLTPFPLNILQGSSQDYPSIIVNLLTQEKVQAKPVLQEAKPTS